MTTEAADGDAAAQTPDNNAETHTRFHLELFGTEVDVEDFRDLVEIFYSGKLGRRVMYGNGAHGRNKSVKRGEKVRLVVDSAHRDGADVDRVTVWSDEEHADSIKDTYWRAGAQWDDEEYEWTINAEPEHIEQFVDDLLYNGEDVQLSMEVVDLLAS